MSLPHISRITHHASWLLAALLTIAWTSPPQEAGIVLVGQVTNGTPGSTAPADLPVTLHVFSGMEETKSYTTTVSADGSFRFDDLTPEEGDAFMVRVVYQDITYVSDLTTLEPGQTELNLPVTVYETTEDPAAILITQLHIFITGNEDRLQMGEYYLVSNTGDRTYVGAEDAETGQRVTLTITPPDEAENIHFDDAGPGGRYLEREGGFADTEPIIPGTATTEVLFSYDLPYHEGLRVERAFDVPVSSVVLVIPDEGLALQGAEWTLEGTMDTQMGPALSYTAGPLAAGEPLAFTLIAQPHVAAPSAPAGSSPTRNTARETATGLTSLAASLVVVYLLWRSPAPAPLPARARPLVEKIAALDAGFEAGSIVEKAYRKKRQALKRQLCQSLAKERGSRGTRERGRP